ncbi:MAG: carbamoyltransferase HypF [Alphaproteobacteria bacterium]|nr:carbamoyltransferase HypF [Alphaproteobacteria bacterium]MDE2630635.1 carbamoyltransferase HypF [Alphaproteobacteria bacterium]
MSRRVRVDVRGAVQGVGFRPFVYRQAQKLGVSGWVENTAFGVRLEAEGIPDAIATLLRMIREIPPPNASIVSIDVEELNWRGDDGFVIRPSAADGARSAQILPDLATCEDCLRELFDPNDRRYLYPFINCTHCGPRYSIVEDVPYDRARTSMRHFPMCPACRAEYEDPLNRRFHAEPNACPGCGPRIALWNGKGATLAQDHDALLAVADAIRVGQIVAVKGVGGFHLLVDARDEAAVIRLRARKQRPDKPLAVMFPTLKDIARECDVWPVEGSLLSSTARPIVLVRRKEGSIAPAVAPGNPWLGAFLPYAPLHHILMHELGFPVIATSGNLSDEPIATDETEALVRLAGIADRFLVHNRPIIRAIDDSVVRVVCGRELVLRRARGFAPAPIAVDGMRSGTLALGGHMKATIALTLENAVLMSQHIGDLETVAARATHGRTVADMVRMRGQAPRLGVRDLHPDYATSVMAAGMGLPLAGVQHHLAHVVACMAEHGIALPALGVAWDGTGYGIDGTIWGGEFLLITDGGWRRVAHLRTFRLPGGEQAVREPRRSAVGLLYEAFGDDAFAMDEVPLLAAFSHAERAVLQTMLAQGVNAPVTSSMGRLFDGFAALCDLRQHASYEGQAAAEFEWAATEAQTPYEFALCPGARKDAPFVLDWKPALDTLLGDRRCGVAAGAVSAAFHDGLAAAIVSVARRIGERRVVLTGGCFQNVRLTEAAVAALRAAGHEPIWHRRVPPNDGGIALGQAVWAACTEGQLPRMS